MQHYLQITLADILGAINIADDILIFAGSIITERDEILKHVFQRLQAKGLTLNLSVFFSKEHLEYFGFIFSKAGMKSSYSKINALKNAEQPHGIKGLQYVNISTTTANAQTY